jgi:hypothetical protein
VNIKPGMSDVLWMLAGAAMLGALVLFFLRHPGGDSTARLASRAERADLVGEMRLALAAASEAEKSAVMAVADEDSERFAAEARRATAEVARDREELARLAKSSRGSLESDVAREGELRDRFSAAFADFQRIDEQLLALAVKNTNIKATHLAFGPAAQSIADMEAALSRVAEKRSASSDASKVALLALGARAAALRIETLIPPHIAEESDASMDALEARMADAAREVDRDLAELASMDGLRTDPDLELASKSFARFRELEKQILSLSRENTNVRSLSMSLDEKRKAMFRCQEALDALQQAIANERIAGIDYARPSNPRGLGAETAVEH